jgi:hypothetical protein
LLETEYTVNDLTTFAEKASDELKAAIETYTTLLNIEGIPEAAVDMALKALETFGKKQSARTGGPLQKAAPHTVSIGDVTHPTLSAALRSVGFHKTTPENEALWNAAWSDITKQFRKGDEATHGDYTFTRAWL